MSQQLKSTAIGIFSGIITYLASVYALARTSAFALPQGFPLAVWDSVVVFGLGVTLVAAVVHFAAITFAKARPSLSFVGFAIAFLASLAYAGLLQTGLKAFVAAMIGALLAIAISRQRSNNSFKSTPLRGAT